jgi:putative glutathione S-transferase
LLVRIPLQLPTLLPKKKRSKIDQGLTDTSSHVLSELNKSGGNFERKNADFRSIVTDPDLKDDAPFKAEKNRYHLYVSYSCPWANRCVAVMNLKRLNGIIGLSVVHPCWGKTSSDPDDTHKGWIFRNPNDPPVIPLCGNGAIKCDEALIPDTVNNCKNVRELYDKVRAPSNAVRSVPILWDKKTNTIVNNESMDIMRMFNGPFAKLVGSDTDTINLYPGDAKIRAQIDEINEWVYDDINNGVYKTGFTKNQASYDANVEKLFHALDRVEDLLSRRRYLCGSQFTEADLRLFVTLVRFDEVYVVYFKCNKRTISSYPNMHQYLRELYQMPWLGSSVNMRHIKSHYYTSHPHFNSEAVIPAGPSVTNDLVKPHDRADRQYESDSV